MTTARIAQEMLDNGVEPNPVLMGLSIANALGRSASAAKRYERAIVEMLYTGDLRVPQMDTERVSHGIQ